MMAWLDVSDEMLKKYAHLHTDPDRARGALMLSRDMAERIHEEFGGCEVVSNQNGTIWCSLDEVLNAVNVTALCTVHQQGWGVPLDEVATGSSSTVGAML
jgi:hypothetical protein